MKQTLQTIAAVPPAPEVNFSWTPTGPDLNLVVDDEVYTNSSSDPLTKIVPPEYAAPVNTPLTLTADVIAPPGVVIIEYRWRFGDGTESYGPVVTHTYQVANPSTRCVLTVLDSTNRFTMVARQMNLRPADLILVEDNVIHV